MHICIPTHQPGLYTGMGNEPKQTSPCPLAWAPGPVLTRWDAGANPTLGVQLTNHTALLRNLQTFPRGPGAQSSLGQPPKLVLFQRTAVADGKAPLLPKDPVGIPIL